MREEIFGRESAGIDREVRGVARALGAAWVPTLLLAAAVSCLLGPRLFPTGLGPGDVAAGDFNRDGGPDLADIDGFADDVSILLNISRETP